jgi:hypothetical protein
MKSTKVNQETNIWNPDSLKEYFSSEIKGLETRMDDKFDSVTQVTENSRAAMEKRLEGMNEFRDQLKDQATKFVTRDELNIQLKAIGDKVQTLLDSKSEQVGATKQISLTWTQLTGGVLVLVAVLTLIFKLLGMY